MRARAWYLYPIGAAVAAAAYLWTSHPGALFNLIGLSSAILILVGVRLHQPEQRAPWYLFAAGQTLFVVGDVIAYNYDTFFHRTLPYPAISDVLYLSVYPCLAAGLLLLVRRRSPGRDWPGFIDSLMVVVGVGTVSWVYLISPYVHDDSSKLLQKLTAVGYPIMDLLLLSVAVRLAVGAGRRIAPSFVLITYAITALLVTDTIYGWAGLHDPYAPGSGLLELGWAAFYVMWAMAALHPSMRELSERGEAKSPRLTWPRLALLGGAALLPPAIQITETIRGNPIDVPVIVGATVVLFVLVVARMAGLVKTQQESAVREQALREAGQKLVTATNAEAIHVAAIDAVRALAGEDAAIRMCEALGGSDELIVVASAGGTRETNGSRFSLGDIQPWKRDRLLENDAYTVQIYESPLRDILAFPLEEDGTVLVAPLFIREEFRGLMGIATPSEMPDGVADSLRALSTQVALALESAALTEDLLKQQSEKRFASLVQNSSDVVLVIDPDTSVRYASPSVQRVIGSHPERLEGRRFIDLVHPDDKTRVLSFLLAQMDGADDTGLMEFRVRRDDETYIFVETLRANLLLDDSVRGIVLNTRDISERKQFEEQLQHQSFHDPVTSLANRALFHDRVSHAIERQERDQKPIAVVIMDLDDFKTINDSLGHVAGDQLLAEVGERLRQSLRAADTAARLGGDEFAILLEDGGEGITAADVAERVMQMLEAPFSLEGKEVFVRASLGIAVADRGSTGTADELLRDADVAMYMAKEKGKGRYQVFEPAMHDTALKRLELKADLQRAVEHHEFVLHYQPVIELETGRVSGTEALVRWIHPIKGLVPPLDFIPLAEETGLIVSIGRWVLTEACRTAVALRARFPGSPGLHMAVNLSARQIARPELITEVRQTLRETGLDPGALILEITESVMMQDMDLSIERLSELKELGVQLAIDDFGTGYSSLNYVRRFPVDILKVDKSFIDGVSEDGESSALTAAVIELAGILNLKPVAEGIERADQLQRLLDLHCDFGQGYFFSKPLPRQGLESLLDERHAMAAEAEALANG